MTWKCFTEKKPKKTPPDLLRFGIYNLCSYGHFRLVFEDLPKNFVFVKNVINFKHLLFTLSKLDEFSYHYTINISTIHCRKWENHSTVKYCNSNEKVTIFVIPM